MEKFAEMLIEVMQRKASDLHLTAGSPPMVREKGQLKAMNYPPLTAQATREIVYSILNNDQRQRLESEWQVDLSYAIPNTARFRVNAYFQRASIGAAFRLIPQETPPLETLGLPRWSASSPRSHAASCSSRVRPARASPPRSPR